MVGSKEDDKFDLGVKGSIPLIDENTCEQFFFVFTHVCSVKLEGYHSLFHVKIQKWGIGDALF